MGTVTYKTGVVNDSNNILQSVLNPMPPFLMGHGVFAKEFVMGTDHESGDDIVVEFEASTQLHFAIGVTNVGAIKSYTEAAIGGTKVGRKLTFSGVTTNLKVYVVYSI